MAFPSDVGADLDNYAEAMKIFYADAVAYTINRRVVKYDMLKKNKKGWTGKYFQQPVHLRSGISVGARGVGGGTTGAILPDASSDVYQESLIYCKYNYVVCKVWNTLDAQTSTQAGAWARARSEQIKLRAKDLADSLNRQMNGNGFGILCEVESVVDNGGNDYDITIHQYADGDPSNSTGYAPMTTHYLKPGMRLAYGTPAQLATGGTPDGWGTVGSVTSSSVFNFDANASSAAAPAANDVFVLGDSATAGERSYSHEVSGFELIFDDAATTFQNINASTYTEWRAQVFENPAGSGNERKLTEDLLHRVIDTCDTESTGHVDQCHLHQSARRAYVNMVKAKNGEHFQPTKVKAGYDREFLSLASAGRNISLIEDKDHLPRRMDFCSSDELKVYEVRPFHWDESNGGVWKWDGTGDAVTAFGKVYCNLGTSNRAALGSLRDIAVTL